MFYGWRIVAVAFLAHCVTTGIVFYSFGVFLQALASDFGWSRAQTALGFSLVALAGAACSPLVGRAVDRFGPRPVQIFGACTMGLGFLLLARIEGLAGFYLLMGALVAPGSTAMGQLPSNAAVARWFVRRRGTALGLATAGISMGGVLFVPLTQFLIATFGWRTAFAVLGVLVVALVVPPVAAFMRTSPEEMGLRPDGAPAPGNGVGADLAAELERSWTPAEAVRHPNFWRIAFAFALAMMSVVATLLHLIGFLGDRGVPAAAASWVLGATAGMGVAGKLGFGALQQRLGERGAILLCFGLQAAGIGLLLAAAGPLARAVFVVVYGFAMGGTATLQATVIAECFGRLHYASIAGRIQPVVVLLESAGLPAVGALRDASGSYTAAFLAVIAANLLAMLLAAGLDVAAAPGGLRAEAARGTAARRA